MHAFAPHIRGARLTAVVAFVALLLATRALFLLGTLDPSQERALEVVESASVRATGLPERPLYDREELYTGTAAEAIRTGLPLPLSTYRFMPYGSGSLLLSLLAVPVYALLGPHYLAFKLIPLLLTALGGWLWFLTVRHWLGPRAAALFGGLYIAAPAVLVRTALIAKGDHPEAMALIGGVLFLATRALAAIEESNRARWAMAAGLLTGIGVYVTYSTVPVLAAVALVALMRTRLRPQRAWAHFGAGLAAGLLPWAAFLISTSGQALLVYGRAPGAGIDAAESWSRVRQLIGSGFMAGYDFPRAGLRTLAALVWLAAVSAGWITLIRARRTAVALAILIGTLVHLLTFVFLAPDASSRYLIPCYPLLLVAAVAFALPAIAPPDAPAGRLRRAGALALIVLVAIGLGSQAWAIQDSRFVALRRPLAGTDWPLLGEIAGAKLTPPAIQRLPDAVRPHFWTGFGRQVMHSMPREQWDDAVSLAREEERRYVWIGIGIAWCESWGLREAATYLPSLPPAPRAALRDGLLRYADYVFASTIAIEGPSIAEAIVSTFAPEDRPAVQATLARSLAVMATQGARLAPREGGTRARGSPGGAAPATPDPTSPRWTSWLEEVCGREPVRAAAGYALYRSVAAAHPPRVWPAPRLAWTAPFAQQLRGAAADTALWDGVAGAYERDLTTCGPRWILGGSRGPLAMAAELARFTHALPAPAAAKLYRAAGRAAANAFSDPAVAARGVSLEAWSWAQAIPPAYATAFGEGLAAQRP
jgi:4-amino-4-deoxy-L-arabinose transferase-like glycosyltransferase